MTVYFISRHPGSIAWAETQGLTVDRVIAHLDVEQIKPGDTVIGTLPVHLAAQVCERGAHYQHLVITIPPDQRGQELTAEDMVAFGATLEAYHVQRA